MEERRKWAEVLLWVAANPGTEESEAMSQHRPDQPGNLGDVTLNAISLDELERGTPPAERWIIGEIRRMREHARGLESHRRRAMAGIAERFQQRLLGYAYHKLGANREEAEDVVQEVFQAVERLLPRVTDEKHLRNLLFKLAKNKCADVVARNRRVTLSNEIHPPFDDWRVVAEPVASQESEPDTAMLRQAIRQLPKLEDRILLTLSLDYHMPIKHIARVLEISEGACKMRRHRARRKLREILERERG